MFDTIREVVPSDLEALEPGPQLGAALASVDYRNLSSFDLVVVLKAQERQVAHYQALSLWTKAAIVERYEDIDEDDLMGVAVEGAAAEIGAALRLTRRSADIETSLALELLRRLPRVWKALLDGAIDLRRARVVVDNTIHLAMAKVRSVADTILPDVMGLTTGQLAHRLQKLCIDLDPEDAKRRYTGSLEDRRVVTEPNPSGTANLLGLDLPPHVVAAIKRRINREARRLRNLGDSRTMDQLRADIYLEFLQGKAATAQKHPSVYRGVVDIHADLATLAGLSESPGELAGYGPVIADIVRQVAKNQQDSEWRWTLVDPGTGLPIDGGITRRRPTTAQRRFVQAHHRTCIHPGCRMPAIHCDIDHRIPWAERRTTDTKDLGPFCRRHHVIRHRHGWSYQPIDNGDFEFTTPLGQRYTTSGRSP